MSWFAEGNGVSVPLQPRIYHITHLDNLETIVEDGWLWSDAKRIQRNTRCMNVGMSTIKERRLNEIEVECHLGTKVGEYTPFYFCPRSVMLYLLYRGNHVDVEYKGGQRPILHLVADLKTVVDWATERAVRWAITDSNASSRLVEFFDRLEDLDKLNWEAIGARDFRDPFIKRDKQAEFLLHDAFPWRLVRTVGVFDHAIQERVEATIRASDHRPKVAIKRAWYF